MTRDSGLLFLDHPVYLGRLIPIIHLISRPFSFPSPPFPLLSSIFPPVLPSSPLHLLLGQFTFHGAPCFPSIQRRILRVLGMDGILADSLAKFLRGPSPRSSLMDTRSYMYTDPEMLHGAYSLLAVSAAYSVLDRVRICRS